MQFRVLSASGADAREWHRLIDRLPESQRDIHFLPEYGRIYRATYGQEPLLATYGDEDCYVIQPFVRRKLNDLPFLQGSGVSRRFFDIANPYGYGGPALSSGIRDGGRGLIRDYDELFLAYCRNEHFAAEFTSLHPRLGAGDLLAGCPSIAPVRLKQVVYIDLGVSREQRWRALRKGHKSSISKARRFGIEIERVTPTPERVEELKRLYYETMRRNQAQQRWNFPRDYFAHCFEQLGERRTSLFLARVDGVTAAASILMHDFGTAYYHFSGSDARYNELGVGTLLVFEMAQWAADAGYRWFHLGGGVSSSQDDSLFRFKSGFSDIRVELQAYGRILDVDTYERLCKLKVQHEIATTGEQSASDYFPLYRR